jgi:hypothetical protein
MILLESFEKCLYSVLLINFSLYSASSYVVVLHRIAEDLFSVFIDFNTLGNTFCQKTIEKCGKATKKISCFPPLFTSELVYRYRLYCSLSH